MIYKGQKLGRVCVRFRLCPYTPLVESLFTSKALQLAPHNPNWFLWFMYTHTHTHSLSLSLCTTGAKHYNALLVSSNTKTMAR